MVKLFDCKISRRGKAARGTVTVKTFGKPIVNDDGIAKDWDYSIAAKYSREEILAELEKLGNVNQLLLMAGDLFNKSQSLQAQSQSGILVARLIADSLVSDKKEAEMVAAAWITLRKNAAVAYMPIPTFDQLFAMRKDAMDKLKSAGQMAPRLVDNRKSVDAEIAEAEEEIISEEEISEEEVSE